MPPKYLRQLRDFLALGPGVLRKLPDGTLGLDTGAPLPYVHLQAVPAVQWTINHNLGYRPDIALMDEAGQDFDAQIVHVSPHQALIFCNPAVAGSARCS